MSSDNMSLEVEILGDASSAVEASNVSQASVDKLTAAIGTLSASMQSQNAASDAATAGVTRMSAAHERATATSDALTSHSLLLARGLDAAGVSAGGAATRVAAMSDVLDRMATAAPGLLALGAALTVAFAGFNVLREGIKDASNMQEALLELGFAAKSSGQATAGMDDTVRKWAESLAIAAGVAESQSVPAVLKLVDAGQSWKGAMGEITVAEQMVAQGMGNVRGSSDMATSSAQRFNQILRALVEAETGHYTALVRIDPQLTKLVASHASLAQIMTFVNQQTADAIEKNNSNAMAWDRLRGIIEVSAERIASLMLPALRDLAAGLFNIISASSGVGKAVDEMARGVIMAIVNMVNAVGHAIAAFYQLAQGTMAAAQGQFNELHKSLSGVVGSVGEVGEGIHKLGTRLFNTSAGAKELSDSLKNLHNTASSGIGSIVNPGYASTSKGSGGTGAVPGASAYEELTPQLTLQNAAEKDLMATTNALDAAKTKATLTENALAIAVKLSTTNAQEGAATQALAAQKTADAAQQVAMLTAAVASEKQHQDALTQSLANAKQTVDADEAAQNKHTMALAGAKKETLDTKEATNQLAGALRDAKNHVSDIQAALAKYTEALKQHQSELTAAQVEEKNAAAEEAEALAATARKWQEFNDKKAQSDADSAAKARMTSQQYLAFLAEQYAKDYNLYIYYQAQKNVYFAGYYEQQAEQASQKLTQAQDAIYQQNFNNYKQMIDHMASIAGTFVQDVFVDHKTMRDELKSIYQDILKDFVSMLEQMMAKALMTSSFLARILGFLGLGGAGGGGASLFSAGLPGVFGSGSGPLGSSGASSGGVGGGGASLGPASAGGSRLSPGSSTGGAIGSGGYGGGATGSYGSTIGGTGAGYFGSGGYGGGFAGPNALSGGLGGAATLLGRGSIGGMGLMGPLMAGVGGDILGNMMFPHNVGAEVGGGLGGLLGALGAGAFLGSAAGASSLLGLFSIFGAAAGPVGMGIGALLGALLGSELGHLFGNHFNAADEPDINQTQLWGQELADLQGSTGGNPMIANGQKFTMDSWTSSQTSGKGWNVMMEQFVSQFRNNQKALPKELQAGFNMLEQLWGGATNHPDFNDNGKNGMLQIGSGAMKEWTTFWQYISAYGPAVAQLMQLYSPTDLYAASLNGQVGAMGGYTPSGDPFLLHSIPDAGGAAPQQVMTNNVGGSRQTVVNVNTYQQFGGSLIAEKAINERIYKAIQALPVFSQLDLTGT